MALCLDILKTNSFCYCINIFIEESRGLASSPVEAMLPLYPNQGLGGGEVGGGVVGRSIEKKEPWLGARQNRQQRQVLAAMPTLGNMGAVPHSP